MAWLDDHPPRRSQFRRPRRAMASGVCVVHTAENSPDFTPPDGGAEAVAQFIRNRTDPGSYHDLVDSDSIFNLVGYDAEAFHDGTGSNPHSYGVSIATRAALWSSAPKAWRDGAVEQAARAAARYATWLRGQRGIVIPARRISRAQSDARLPGFISHAERDPGRRTDPGKDFPWAAFLARFAQLTSLTPAPQPPPPEDDDMAAAIQIKTDGRSARMWFDGAIIGFKTESDRANLLKAFAAADVKVGTWQCTSGQFDAVARTVNDTAQLEALKAIESAVDGT